ncbi:MAG: AAA+ family ATPase, partial [Planctomycetota bacterium]|nr:AAA+ family ATPase [Planctomycetota bacterium]
TFAFAESYDDKTKRYAGLKGGQNVNVPDDGLFGILVKPDIAFAQIAADTPLPASSPTNAAPGAKPATKPAGAAPIPAPAQPAKPKRFYGSVKIDAARMNRDAGQISQEVVQHLVGLLMADVDITIEIQATVPDGFPDSVVRTVGENCRTLKFTQQDFAAE